MPTSKRSNLAKLARPRLHGAVPRERLFALLDGAREGPVVWISGPPGAGKTTLVASYLDARHLGAIWYQLDASDADIGAFFHYLSTAVEALDLKLPPFGPHAETMSDPIAFGREYFRQFFGSVQDDIVLVLDNYQEVAEDAALHTILRNAIEEIPEGIRFIVVSRALPPNAFARHRAHGNVLSIGFSELKLTLDETRTVAQRRGLVDSEAVTILHSQTDGWFAGLTLLMEHAGRSTITRAPKPESLEEVFQYFAGEMFDAANPEQQQTLIQTAFLPILTANTAERISANPHAHELLEQLYQRQLFVDRRLGTETTYQYHALFREFLLARAREIFTPVGLRQLVRRAAALLWESGITQEAVDLMLQAEDWSAATSAILQVAPTLFESSRWDTLNGWIGKLPRSETERNGWLQFWYGAANFAQRPQFAQEQLGLAYESFEREADTRGQILTCSAVLRAYHSNIHGEFQTIGGWISRLVRLLEHPVKIEATESLDVHASLLMGIQYHDPQNPFRSECAHRVVELLENQTVSMNQKGYAAGLAINYLVGDDHADLERAISAVSPLLEKPLPESVSDLYLWHYYGLYCQAIGNFASARRYVNSVIPMEDTLGMRRMAISARWFQHINCIAARDVAGLEAIRAQVLPRADEGKAYHLSVFHSISASILLFRGDVASAIQHLESNRRASHHYNLWLHEAAALVALAATTYEQGDISSAAMYVDQGLQLSANSSMVTEYRELTMLGALVCDAQNQVEQARRHLVELFAKGLPLLWAIFHTPNEVPARACALALREQVAVPAALKMIKRYRLQAPAPDLPNWPRLLRIRTLGQFLVLDGDEPLGVSRKVQRRPLELLKALIAFGSREVNTLRLAEVLWPDLDGDAAMGAFHAALLRLRKLLRHDGVLKLTDGKLSLDQSHCWVDTVAIEQVFERIERTSKNQDAGIDLTSLLDLYRGDFLASEGDGPWLLPARENLRRRFLSCVARVGDDLEAQQRWTEATTLYGRALTVSNLAEDIYRRLMRCHIAQGKHSEALETYRRCRELLSVVLSTKPSAETDALYRRIERTNS